MYSETQWNRFDIVTGRRRPHLPLPTRTRVHDVCIRGSIWRLLYQS